MTPTTSTLELQIKSLTESGIFTGYAAVFGKADLQGETIAPGAFRDTLAKHNPIALLMSHEYTEPIGIFRQLQEDNIGLFVEGELNLDTSKGKEAYSLLKQGALTGLSISFIVDSYTTKKDGSRNVTKLTLLEISLTPVPCQPLAQVTSVKSADAINWNELAASFQRFLKA
jgi:uncharacterized protein